MSVEGQKRKRQSAFATAGLPPKADITRTGLHFRFVPEALIQIRLNFQRLRSRKVSISAILAAGPPSDARAIGKTFLICCAQFRTPSIGQLVRAARVVKRSDADA